jgi:PAS domain S-box-containing protein
MGWQYHPAFGPLLVSAGIAITVAVAVLRWRRIPGALPLAGLMAGAAIWCGAYGIELSSAGRAEQLFWARLQYVGIQTVPTLWLLFAAAFAGRPLTRAPRLAALLLIQPIAILALIWTNDTHGLIWVSSSSVERGGLLVLQHANGPLYLANVAYAYALLLVGWVIVARHCAATWGIYRRQAMVVLLGALFPWIGNALYVGGLAPLGYLDLTPFAFALSGAMASWGLVYYRMLDIVPLARDTVLERLGDPIIVVDDQERVVDLNGAARELADPGGSLGQRLLGQPVADIFRNLPAIAAIVRGPAGQPSEFAASVKGAHREYEGLVVPVERQRGDIKARIAIVHDITAHKQAERELLAARDRADAANRAKSTFLANVSHELRTPLSLIMGYGELLRDGANGTDSAQQADRADQVLNAARHLLALIEEVLDLSAIEAGRLELRAGVFDADELVAGVSAAAEPLVARRGNRLVVDTVGRLGAAKTDPDRLRQVLLHLLGNAAKHTSDGTVRLTTWRQEVAGGDWLTFRVSDTGVGIEPHALDTLFEPFARGDRQPGTPAGGPGLGLALSFRIAQLLGGSLTVASTVNVGSDFTLRVPASRPQV